MTPYQQIKFDIAEFTGLAQDVLHVYVAVILFFGSCLAFKWKARQWKPWLLVLLAALAGEALDIRDQLATPWPIKWGESVKDILNTLMVPTAILLAARFSSMFRED